jgi:hypothetical protein
MAARPMTRVVPKRTMRRNEGSGLSAGTDTGGREGFPVPAAK